MGARLANRMATGRALLWLLAALLPALGVPVCGADGYEADDVIVFDEVDRYSAAGNLLSYRLVQRLFAQRPRASERSDPRDEDVLVLGEHVGGEDPGDRFVLGVEDLLPGGHRVDR